MVIRIWGLNEISSTTFGRLQFHEIEMQKIILYLNNQEMNTTLQHKEVITNSQREILEIPWGKTLKGLKHGVSFHMAQQFHAYTYTHKKCKHIVHTKTCTQIAALLKQPKQWEQPNSSSTDKQINKL
jgi:hypothetical protein